MHPIAVLRRRGRGGLLSLLMFSFVLSALTIEPVHAQPDSPAMDGPAVSPADSADATIEAAPPVALPPASPPGKASEAESQSTQAGPSPEGAAADTPPGGNTQSGDGARDLEGATVRRQGIDNGGGELAPISDANSKPPAAAADSAPPAADVAPAAADPVPHDSPASEAAPGTGTGTETGKRPAAEEPAHNTPTAAPAQSAASDAASAPADVAPAGPAEAPAQPDNPAAGGQQDLVLLGNRVPPGTSTRLAWSPSESFAGITVPTPVLVVNGAEPGPTLCLTAAIHGDELTGIEIVRRVMFGLNAKKLRGAVIGVPIVNLQGFRRNSRYLPDRRDLNRYFPGVPNGSLAARVAHSFFQEVASRCDAIVDMHTGSFHRTNLPQVRADMNHAGVATLARNLGAIVVLQSRGNAGTLRRAAVEHGIPAVTLEAGEPMRLVESHVAHGVQSIQSLLNGMQMSGRTSLFGQPEPIYYKSVWVRSNSGGILFSRVKLGDRVRKGDVLGTVTDPITNARAEVATPLDGRIIGMALNQVVMPGFAAYHIGVQTTEAHAAEPVVGVEADEAAESDDEPASAADSSKAAIEHDKEAAPFEERDEPDVLEDS